MGLASESTHEPQGEVLPASKQLVPRVKGFVRTTYRGGLRLVQKGILSLRDPYVALLFLAFLASGIYWSYLTIERFYAMYAGVFDLGLYEEKTWTFLNPGPITIYNYVTASIDEPFILLMSPTGYWGYPANLTLQSFALASGSLPLFGIARKLLQSRFSALCLAGAYLLYFPLGGVNWFDLHFIAFFIPLFLFGYYLMLHAHYKWALAILLIAGSTEYPVVILVVVFAFTLVVEDLYHRFLLGSRPEGPPFKFSLVLLVASGLFFAYQYEFLQTALGPSGFAATIHTTYTGQVVTLDQRITAALLLLAPTLFLAVLTPRWLIMLVPSLYLIFDTTYLGYVYPELFQTQYSALFIPVVFLGTVYALRWVGMLPHRAPAPEPPPVRSKRFLLRHRDYPTVPTIALAVLAVTALLATVYQPWGPYNVDSDDSFDAAQRTVVNMTLFEQVQQLESLVPRSTPYVLFQNDMPSMLPRPLDYLNTPEVSGIGDWQNVSTWDAERGSFPYLQFNNTVGNFRVDYMIDDPYSWGFTEQGIVPANTMANFITTGYGSGAYGILGELNGMMVLEHGYSGPPQLYVPLRQSIPASALDNWTHTGPSGTPIVSFSNGSASSAWDGPYFYLAPGRYQFQFSLMTTSLAPTNHVSLFVNGNYGESYFNSRYLTGASFNATNVWTPFTVDATLNNTYADIGLPGIDVSWSGTLSIQYIEITQLAPGAPTFTP